MTGDAGKALPLYEGDADALVALKECLARCELPAETDEPRNVTVTLHTSLDTVVRWMTLGERAAR